MDTQTPDLQAVVQRQCRELAERLEKVEGENRRLKRRGLVMLAAASALALAGVVMAAVALARGGPTSAPLAESEPAGEGDVKTADVVRARAFEVVDEDGQMRAHLSDLGLILVDPLGGEFDLGDVRLSAVDGLEFRNSEGDVRVELRRIWLRFYDWRGEEAFFLDCHQGLTLADSEAQTRIILRTDMETNKPSILLLGEDGNITWQAPPPEDGPDDVPEEAEAPAG